MANAHYVISNIPNMSKQAAEQSGSSYDVFVRVLSGMVDCAIAELSPEEKSIVIAYSVRRFGYLTVEQIEEHNADMWEEGICSHGLTENTCPCGCFEFN
ncbi:hypothetical protein [Chromobacterium sp. Panama]|uniref:hypothetical protein n=1 Tax=Chromobacterium sp. Panama TaxID=2161826 RepID=UPI0011B27D2A|nr:hypothetical protein [Chromobacterium sp. Panama]